MNLTLDALFEALARLDLKPIRQGSTVRSCCPHDGHPGDRSSRSSSFSLVPVTGDPSRLKVAWKCWSYGCDAAAYVEVMAALGLGHDGYEPATTSLRRSHVPTLHPARVNGSHDRPETPKPDGLAAWLVRSHEALMAQEYGYAGVVRREDGTLAPIYNGPAWNYAVSRFPVEDIILNLVGLGVEEGVPDGYGHLVGRLVVPLFGLDGLPTVAQGRSLDGGKPKWIWPTGSPRRGPAFVLPPALGSTRRSFRRDVLTVVCEGPPDGIALAGVGIQALVTGGTGGLTSAHARRLKASGLRSLAVGLDGDEAGRRAVSGLVRTLAEAGIQSVVVRGPGDGQDWADIYQHTASGCVRWHDLGARFSKALMTSDGIRIAPWLAAQAHETEVGHGERLDHHFMQVRKREVAA